MFTFRLQCLFDLLEVPLNYESILGWLDRLYRESESFGPTQTHRGRMHALSLIVSFTGKFSFEMQ